MGALFVARAAASSSTPPGGIPAELRAPRGGMAPPPQAEAEEDNMPPMPPQKPTEAPKFLQISHNDKGICTLKLGRPPVNSLSLEMFRELNDWLLYLGGDEETKAVILTSAIPLVYSAGLDINELHNPKEDRMTTFWSAFQENWLILNSYPKPLIAAINGNAPAGGCILSLACDYRIMAAHPKDQPTKPFRIGLNETKLGIVAPPWVMAGFRYVVGTRKAERMLQLGETPTAEEALAIGLVDKVVQEADVLAEAEKEAARFLAIPNNARWMSRDMMRQEVTQFLASDEEREYDTNFFKQMMGNEDVQRSISGYLARLSGNKKK